MNRNTLITMFTILLMMSCAGKKEVVRKEKIVPEAAPIDLTTSLEKIHFSRDGAKGYVYLKMTNSGDKNIPNMLVHLYIGSFSEAGEKIEKIGEKYIQNFKIGTTITEKIQWDPESGKYNVYILIDPKNEIKETDEKNNVIRDTIIVN